MFVRQAVMSNCSWGVIAGFYGSYKEVWWGSLWIVPGLLLFSRPGEIHPYRQSETNTRAAWYSSKTCLDKSVNEAGLKKAWVRGVVGAFIPK